LPESTRVSWRPGGEVGQRADSASVRNGKGIAVLYEQLGHPDRARQEWQRAAAVRARAERERDSQTRPTTPQGS
jgi:hypothetical protein